MQGNISYPYCPTQCTLFLDPRFRREGPMNSVSSVSDAKFSELVHYFFLIFSVKLGDHKCRKVTEPDFSGKFSFGQKWGKRPQNRVFRLLCKIESLVFARNDLKLSILWLANFLRKSHIWENSHSQDLGQKGPKKEQKYGFWTFVENWVISFSRNSLKWSFLWLTFLWLTFCANPISGKILILEIYVQKLSTNQIARSFKLLYRLNRLTVFIFFLHEDRIP